MINQFKDSYMVTVVLLRALRLLNWLTNERLFGIGMLLLAAFATKELSPNTTLSLLNTYYGIAKEPIIIIFTLCGTYNLIRGTLSFKEMVITTLPFLLYFLAIIHFTSLGILSGVSLGRDMVVLMTVIREYLVKALTNILVRLGYAK